MAEDTTIFRTAIPVTETPASPVEKTSSPTETITTFEHTEKPPSLEENYYAKMFELGDAATHFEMPKLTQEINEYVLSEIKRQNLEDSAKAYKEIIDHYLGRLKLPENIDEYTKAERLHELMMIDKKLLEAAKAKEELLAKPITELSSKQLKARIEGKL